MTIQRAMQLEEVNNELIQVLLGLTARVRTAVKMLNECGDVHATITTTLLSTFQAESLLKKVAPTVEEVLLKKGAAFEGFADAARSELQGEREAEKPIDILIDHCSLSWPTDELDLTVCSNPSCVDGLAPRKTGPDDGDVDMEPCPACGGPG